MYTLIMAFILHNISYNTTFRYWNSSFPDFSKCPYLNTKGLSKFLKIYFEIASITAVLKCIQFI